MTTAETATDVSIAALPPSPLSWELTTDVVIIGAGAAGLSAATVARRRGLDVLVLTKGASSVSASQAAQGGLAAAVGHDDSPELHLADTLAAGAGLCDSTAATDLVNAAPPMLAHMVGTGVRFDRLAGDVGSSTLGLGLDLGREGGHARRRIAHAADATGHELVSRLACLVPDGLRFAHGTVLLDVLIGRDGGAAGVIAGHVDAEGGVEAGRIFAKAVVLATGGVGQAWATTSNPVIATGDGLAAAVRAGAAVRDLEFVQFHPTVLFRGPGLTGQQPLVTEALRGEGAVLVDANGCRVMLGRHPMADLAPRDVVATQMARRMREAPGGVDDHLYLDASMVDPHLLRTHFTQLHATCSGLGLDPSSDPIPVAPGAHYMCGGVAADLWGHTSVPRLYAIGEVAATGLHGANRLASNSLTEAVVTGQRCGAIVDETPTIDRRPRQPPTGNGISHAARSSITAAMSRGCGVLRSGESLNGARSELGAARAGRAMTAIDQFPMRLDDLETTSLHTVATLVALAATLREESRGCHQRDDFPSPSNRWLRRLEFIATDGAVRCREVAAVTP